MELVKRFISNTFMRPIPEDVGEVLAEWEFPEFEKFERSKHWFIGMGVVFAAVMAYALFSTNFLFAIILLLFAFIGVFQHYQHPETLAAQITEDGIVLHDRFYHFGEFKSFWIVYDPPKAKNLYFDFKNEHKRSIVIPLQDGNPLKIREVLEEFLDENFERETEFFDETISRMIKFQ